MNEFRIEELIGEIERGEDVNPRELTLLLTELKAEVNEVRAENARLIDELRAATTPPVELTEEENVGVEEFDVELDEDDEEVNEEE